MLKLIMKAVLALVLILSGACIPSGSMGPTTWIDQPLDGSLVPLAPITITAHSTSKNGIKQIEFYSNLHSQAISVVQGDGGSLFEAQVEWTPPGLGTYNLSARAMDNSGVVGDQAWATVNVVAEIATPLEVLPTKAPTLIPFGTLEVLPTATPTSTPTVPTLTPSLTVTPPTTTMTSTFTPTPKPALPNGAPTLLANSNANCRTGPGVAYAIDDGLHQGDVGIIDGRNADNSWVWIREPSGGGGHCWVSADVGTLSGDLTTVLIIKAPPLPITVTPTSSSPPQVSIQIGDTKLETDGNPCSNHPTTTPVNATISASAALSKVSLHWSGVKSGSKSMQSTGGDNYRAILGSFSKAGTLSVWVTAVDENGVQGASQTITVKISSGCVP